MKTLGKVLSKTNISKKVLNAAYAPRGPIVVEANEIQKKLEKPNHGYPFEKVIMCNIGNPQEVGQSPLTVHRQVLAACLSPNLLIGDNSPFPNDVQKRAKRILDDTPCYSVGAYTHSQGYRRVRETVCDYIFERDSPNTPCPSIEDIFLTDGASVAIKTVMQCILGDENDGCLLPVPQYPLYSAQIALLGGSKIDYAMHEELQWGFNIKETENSIQNARKDGITPKCMVVVNPGNPTGNCLNEKDIKSIIELAYNENMVLFADEVYQENIYTAERPFISFNKVLNSMGTEYSNNLEMASFHSVSKGVMGECGLRGGYMHLTNIDKEGHNEIYKLLSICLCSNTIGQIAVDLTLNKPKPGDESYSVFKKEYDELFEALKRKAKTLTTELNKLNGISCQPINSAMYAYPTIKIPEKAVKEAKKKGIAADAMYCMNLLKEYGICTIPGSGFGQKDGTYHFRTTILPPENQIQQLCEKLKQYHNEFMQKWS